MANVMAKRSLLVHETEENLAQTSVQIALTASRVVNRPSSPGQLLREEKIAALFGVFPMLVPSLSWQSDQTFCTKGEGELLLLNLNLNLPAVSACHPQLQHPQAATPRWEF
eukprot:COSAG06_NODE_13582_length_1242_cov_1.632546_1_plen_110_part_10